MKKNIFFAISLLPILSCCATSIIDLEKNGVFFEQPDFVVISPDSHIGSGTGVGCGVHILNSQIGKGCTLGHFTIIKNSIVGNNVKIHSHCVLENVVIEDNAEIGPFANLKEGSVIREQAVIGNFVEVTRSTVGKGSKAKHLSYLGDAELGEKVNIGAGTITCNYNGVSKNKTIIEDNALIGSDNCLVAPINIGKGAMTGAGSTLTNDVPEGALAIGRSRQTNKDGYVAQLLEKYRTKKNISTH